MKTVTRDRLAAKATKRATFFTRRYAFFLVGACLLTATIAYHGQSKVSQCNQLVAIVNKVAEARPKATGMTIAEDNRLLLRTAIKLDGYADDLAMMEFSNKQIQALQAQFIKLYRDTSKASGAVVSAPVNNLQTVQQANKAFIETQERESPLVQEVNQYCRSKQWKFPSI
ncbi:MAG: hypothetical protein RBJ76_12605 [Stenomitos frigidus ULC029]